MTYLLDANIFSLSTLKTLPLAFSRYYLVAYAHARNLVVVTHELPSSSTKRIKIPDACIALDVKVMSPYEMLRTERVRFILASP